MKFLDRLLTIVITATLVSAFWIVFGSVVLESADEGDRATDPGMAESEPGGAEARQAEQADAADAPPLASADSAPAAPAPTPPAPRTELLIPVAGVSANALTDSFLDPQGTSGLRRNEAIDIMAPEGTPVLAAAAGTIAKLHDSRSGGMSIYVRSLDRTRIYFYAHLSAYAPGLREGQRIARGVSLGTVGRTGNPSPDEPHLHFAVYETSGDAQWWEPANAINPYPLLTEPLD